MKNRRVWIAVAVVLGGLIVVDLVAQGLDRAIGGNQPGGASGSSYATAPTGLAAFGSLLVHYGHDIVRQRGSISESTLPENATVFVVEPSELTNDDAFALRQFVITGGRLIVGGDTPFYLRNLSDHPPEWEPGGASLWPVSDPSLGNVHRVEGAAAGAWSAPGAGRVLVGRSDSSLLTREVLGRGEIFFLADASPLENASLSTADDAAFGLELAGDGRQVVFTEGVHGYGRSRGIAAIPDRWKLALLLAAIAALAFVWSRARRFGPPDQVARDLPPARAEYVDAVSINLERTHDRVGALSSAQHWTRARVMARASLGPNASNEELARAARTFGCSDEEITALLTPVSDDASVMALGRAVARIGGGDRRMP